MSETTLFSHVECLCGKTAAIPEGGHFPLCGQCGRRMVAPPVTDRVHYVVEVDWDTPRSRQYTDEQLTEALEARGWPSEPCEWPQTPRLDMDDGSTHGVPPWEYVA